MASEHSIRRYRHWYAKLLRLYSKPYHERFGEGMEQTFNDLLRGRAERGLFGCALWMFVETSAGIIKEYTRMILVQNRNIVRIVLAAGLLLLVPLLAMLITDEVAWDLADFVVAGVLLVGTGLTYELVAKRMGSVAYRAAVGVAVATALILVWMNLAVGLIGSEGNPANLMYGGVLAVGLIGAVVARLQARGMARALFATALAQAMVPVIALIVWKPAVASTESSLKVLGLNAFFVLLFVGSALLFRRAGATGSK